MAGAPHRVSAQATMGVTESTTTAMEAWLASRDEVRRQRGIVRTDSIRLWPTSPDNPVDPGDPDNPDGATLGRSLTSPPMTTWACPQIHASLLRRWLRCRSTGPGPGLRV
ncbi:hypothetical protein NHF46_01740 [Arthrobacter alpinus]|nr:hypothetical protein [Arthrobacter alpinus]